MPTSKSDNPYEDWVKQKQDVVQTTTDTVEEDNPFAQWLNPSKKKVGGNGLSNGQPSSQSKLPSKETIDLIQPESAYDFLNTKGTNLLPEIIHRASVNYKNGNMTEDDVAILGGTAFGKQTGLSQVLPEHRETAARAHNVITKNDIMPAVDNISRDYFPTLSKVVKNPDELFSSFKNGSPSAIKDVRDNITSLLKNKIEDIQNKSLSSIYSMAGSSTQGIPVSTDNIQPSDAKTISNLQDQIKAIDSSLNDYGLRAITEKHKKLASNNITAMDFEAVGEEYSKYFGDHAQFVKEKQAQNSQLSPTQTLDEKVANQNIKYKNTALGVQAAIDNLNINAASSYFKGFTTSDNAKITEGNSHIETIQALQSYLDDLPIRFPSVARNFVSSYIGDIISKNKSDEKFSLHYHFPVNNSDVEKAVAQVKKDTPEIYNKYKSSFDSLTSNDVTKRGFLGGISSGLDEIGFGIDRLFTTDEQRASQLINRETQANIHGTEYSEPLKIMLDNEGKAFRQVPSENYTGYSWYGAGKSIPSLAAWMALSTATSGVVNLATVELAGAGASETIGAGKIAANLISNAIPSYVLTYSGHRDMAEQLVDDKSTIGEIKKNIVANTMTLATPLVFGALDFAPSKILENAVMRTTAKDLVTVINKKGIEGLTKDDFYGWVNSSLKPKTLAALKSAGVNLETGIKGGAAMVVNQKADDLISLIANPEAHTSSFNDNVNTFVQGALTIVAAGLPGMIATGFSPSYKDNLYRASLFPDEYIQQTNQQVKDGVITQKQAGEIIKVINTLKESAAANPTKVNEKGLPLINRQTRDLVIADFRQRSAKGLQELGHNIDASKVENEVTSEKKDILKENYSTDIEETPAFKYIQQNNPEIKTYSDLESDISKDVKYLDNNGNEVVGNAAQVITHLSTTDKLDIGSVKKSEPTVESAVIEINGKTYEGKNHAEAILKAKAAGEDISNVDRKADGKFKLSDGTIIDRAEVKNRFGQDRSELLIPQDEVAKQADIDYAKESKKPTKETASGTTGIDERIPSIESKQTETSTTETIQAPTETVSNKDNSVDKPKLLKEDYDLSKHNESDAMNDIGDGLGFVQYGYKKDGDTVIRIKNHTPDWSNFVEDIEDNGAKKVINVTVGDYRNSDRRRSKTTMEEMQQRYPNIEFKDIQIEDGESINDAISKIHNELKSEQPKQDNSVVDKTSPAGKISQPLNTEQRKESIKKLTPEQRGEYVNAKLNGIGDVYLQKAKGVISEADISNEVLKDDKNIGDYVSKAKSVLESLYPNAKLEVYDNAKEYKAADGETGTRGIAIMDKNGKHRILLNLEAIKKDNSGKTAFHEVIHPIVYDAFGVDAQKIIPIWNEIATAMKDVEGMDKVFKHAENYSEKNIAQEGITELLTQVAAGKIDLNSVPKSAANKIIDLINRLFNALGINIKLNSINDFHSIADNIKNSFATGNTEGLKDVIKGKNIDKYIAESEKKLASKDLSPQEFNDKIKELRDEGFSDEEIKKVLQKRNVSDEKINEILSQSKTEKNASTQSIEQQQASLQQGSITEHARTEQAGSEGKTTSPESSDSNIGSEGRQKEIAKQGGKEPPLNELIKEVRAAFAGGEIKGEVINDNGERFLIKAKDGTKYPVLYKDILKENETLSEHYKPNDFDKKVDDATKKIIDFSKSKIGKGLGLSSGAKGAKKSGISIEFEDLVKNAAKVIKKAYHAGEDVGVAINNAVEFIKENWDKAWGEFEKVFSKEDFVNSISFIDAISPKVTKKQISETVETGGVKGQKIAQTQRQALRKQIQDFAKGFKEGVQSGLLGGQMSQGRKMATEMREMQERHANEIEKLGSGSEKEKAALNEKHQKEIEKLKAQFDKREQKATDFGYTFGKAEEKYHQQQFSKYINDFVKDAFKNKTVNKSQAVALIRRAAKVGSSEVRLKNFVDYANKVIEHSDYVDSINDVKAMQKAAQKIQSPFKSVVKAFTNINPEKIPVELLTKYKQALDEMTGRAPKYNLMQEMYYEVETLKNKQPKEFENLKTFKEAESLWSNIHDSKIESVEDYRGKINDINQLKTKLNQLAEDGSIEKADYDALMKEIGETQAEFEKQFAPEIESLRTDLVNEIKGKAIFPNEDATIEERTLLQKVHNLTTSDLKALSFEELHTLNELIDNVNDGFVDVLRIKRIVDNAEGLKEGSNIATETNKLEPIKKSSDELVKKLAKSESVFWEGLLGYPRRAAGAIQKYIISPFVKAIANYSNDIKNGFGKFSELKKKYVITPEQMNKIGMVVHYLQEYSAQFNPRFKNIKEIGTRDRFAHALTDPVERNNYSTQQKSVFFIKHGLSEVGLMDKVYAGLPKDANGKVNPKDVYESFTKKDGKYLTASEQKFLDEIQQWETDNLTDKQRYANEIRGKEFEEIPFHMIREYKQKGSVPSASGEVNPSTNNIRIKSPSGEERTVPAESKLRAVETNYEKLFIKKLETTSRDFHLTNMLQSVNKVLNTALEKTDGANKNRIIAMQQNIADALTFEFGTNRASDIITRTLLNAKAAEVLLRPERTFLQELPASISYMIRARTGEGVKNLFTPPNAFKELLNYTNSPLRLRENINKAFDVDEATIKKASRLEKATLWLSGLPERTMMKTVWMPTFETAFKDATGEVFNAGKFKTDANYKTKFDREIKESASTADAQTEKIIGTTAKAAGRREIEIAPGKSIEKSSSFGSILGFFGNYPYRELHEFLNGFKEMNERFKEGEGVNSLTSLSKPIGIVVNLMIYGTMSALVYGWRSMLFGTPNEQQKGKEIVDTLLTPEGFLNELGGNIIQMGASKYGQLGRTAVQSLATIAYSNAKTKEQKANIRQWLKGATYMDVAPLTDDYKGDTRMAAAKMVTDNMASLSLVVNRLVDAAGGIDEAQSLMKEYSEGTLTGDKKEIAQAIDVVVKASQIFLNTQGTSIPMYQDLQQILRGRGAGQKPSQKPTRGVQEVF